MANTGGSKMADYAKDIKEILSIVTEIKVQNATRDEKIDRLEEVAKRNYECLEGNGKPGLKADMENVQTKIKLFTWVIGIAGGAIVADGASRLIALLK